MKITSKHFPATREGSDTRVMTSHASYRLGFAKITKTYVLGLKKIKTQISTQTPKNTFRTPEMSRLENNIPRQLTKDTCAVANQGVEGREGWCLGAARRRSAEAWGLGTLFSCPKAFQNLAPDSPILEIPPPAQPSRQASQSPPHSPSHDPASTQNTL